MTFNEFCDLCNLEVICKKSPNTGNLWIAKFTDNKVFQGAGDSPSSAIFELSKSVEGHSFKDFPQALEYAVIPKFCQSEHED